MFVRRRSYPFLGAFTACFALESAALSAQISTEVVLRNREAFRKQASDADMKREGGTQPRDWDYDLPEGVMTRQVVFYVDGGTPLYGKMFLPKGFRPADKRAAVVVGHGINALSIGIEKYAARFAERGLVAMAIDYRSYGFSGSGADDLRLLDPDPTTDAHVLTEKRFRILVKRTNLNNAHEVEDVRAAMSYLQGEAGVDAGRIGVWGSSNGGSVAIAVASIDARARAVVAQVAGPRPIPRGPAPLPTGAQAVMLDDAIKRARTGQGAEVDAGFSFRSKVDLFSTFRNRDVRPGATLDQIADTTSVLFLPAEKDELTNGPGGAEEAARYLAARGVTAQAIVLPEITHFQAYSSAGFEVGSTLAAEWFLKYLATQPPAKPATPPLSVSQPPAAGLTSSEAQPLKAVNVPDGVSFREVKFFSEAVQCGAKIFTPKGFAPESKAPAVVLAPAPGRTAAPIEKYAAEFAGRGLVAMVIDYRGWGRSGGFLYLAEPLRWDDRLRFSQHTARVRIRRKRLIPDAQVLDIRNAISYLQGESGVDRTRIGVWGTDAAGGHGITTAARDLRVKAVVAQVPEIDGKDLPRRARMPDVQHQAVMVKLARTGQPPASMTAAMLMNEAEAKLARAEYHPFWYVDQIPQTTAVLFIVAERDMKVANDANAIAASQLLKGPNGVTVVPGAAHTLTSPGAFEAAVEAAAAWFQKYL